MTIKRDQDGRFWQDNNFVGFEDGDKLFVMGPMSLQSIEITANDHLPNNERIEKWLKPFRR